MFEYLNICVSFLVCYELFAGTEGMPLPTYIDHTKNIMPKSLANLEQDCTLRLVNIPL
jgi:hypothetical protein